MPLRSHSSFGAPLYASGAAVPASAATLTALKAITDPGDLTHGNEVLVDEDGSRWRWHATSTLAGDDLFVVTPDAAPAAGRWLRSVGTVDLRAAISHATADGATLLTLPSGARLLVRRCYWEITTGFTGGTSSAIGLAGPSPYDTAGDIHGGSGGDVAASLTAGIRRGTVGADIAAGVLLGGDDAVTFERIASAFTAGAGYAHVVGELVANPGA